MNRIHGPAFFEELLIMTAEYVKNILAITPPKGT
jgi:hypothetical protein